MAKALYVSGKEYSISANTARYFPIGSGYGGAGLQAVEGNSQTICKRSITFSKLNIYVKTNTKNTANGSVTFRNNGANGNMVVSIPFGTTGLFTDLTNTDTVAAGNTSGLLFSYGSGTGTTTYGRISVVADYTGVETITIFQNAPLTSMGANTTYIPISGYSVSSTIESVTQLKVPKAGTFKNAIIRVSSNSRDGDSLIRLRVNGSNTSILVTVIDSSTGVFEDVTNTATIAVDDLVTFSCVRGGTGGTTTISYLQCDFDTTSDSFITSCEQSSALAPASPTTYYQYIGGETPSTYTDTDTQVNFSLADYSANNLRIGVQTNTIAATTNIYLRKNGVDTALTVAIPASTSGYFSDTTNTVSIAQDDDLNYKIDAGGSGSLLIRRSALAFTKDSITVSVNNDNMFFWF